LIKWTVKYKDFDDNEVEEDLYFHLKTNELVELEVSIPEGFEAWVTRVAEQEDKAELFKVFTLFLRKGYGLRSPDGRRHIKNAQVLEDFESSLAYEAAFKDVLMDTDKLIAFFTGIMPKDLHETAAAIAKAQGLDVPPPVPSLRPVEAPPEKEKIPHNELAKMDRERHAEAMSRVAEGSAEVIYSEPPISQ
jgi:hypothetical protein